MAAKRPEERPEPPRRSEKPEADPAIREKIHAAIRQILTVAAARAGGMGRLGEQVSQITGRTFKAPALVVRHWIDGTNMPSADLLAAILIANPDLSLKEALDSYHLVNPTDLLAEEMGVMTENVARLTLQHLAVQRPELIEDFAERLARHPGYLRDPALTHLLTDPYDDEPLTDEDLQAAEEGRAAVRRGDVVRLEDLRLA